MKRKRAYACHHRNEWVVVHSLVEACFIGSIAVRTRVWCSQWRPCQPPRQWWAPCSGMVSSAYNTLPAAILALCLAQGSSTWLFPYCYSLTCNHTSVPTCNIQPFSVCVGVRHWPGTWAVFLWWKKESGLHPLLQIQKKTGIQATSLHYIQWKHTTTDTGPMGSRRRVWGGWCTCRRYRGVKAVWGGEGSNEGGVWSWSPGSWTTDRAW